MAIQGGVAVTGFIAPTGAGDKYPVIDPIYGIDGLRNVTGGTEMLLTGGTGISLDRRRAGMIVGINTGDYYSLNSQPWDGTLSDWTLLNFKGGNTGDYLPLSGGTVSGGTTFTDGLTADTISGDIVFGATKGNVGIGKIPRNKLDVGGSISATSHNQVLTTLNISDLKYTIGTYTGITKSLINLNTTGLTTADNYINAGPSGYSSFAVNGDQTTGNIFLSANNAAFGYNWYLQFQSSYDNSINSGPYVGNLNFKIGNANKMVLKQNGNLLLNNLSNGSVTGSTIGSSLQITGHTLTGGYNDGLIYLKQTWNTSGDTNAFVMDITNTNSSLNTNLLNFRVNNTSVFLISKNGNLTASTLSISGGTSSQYLMADGSTSTGSYGNYLPLSGGTLTGGVTGTTLNLNSLSLRGLNSVINFATGITITQNTNPAPIHIGFSPNPIKGSGWGIGIGQGSFSLNTGQIGIGNVNNYNSSGYTILIGSGLFSTGTTSSIMLCNSFWALSDGGYATTHIQPYGDQYGWLGIQRKNYQTFISGDEYYFGRGLNNVVDYYTNYDVNIFVSQGLSNAGLYDTRGSNLVLNGGKSVGTGNTGDIIFATATRYDTSSSTNVQISSKRWWIKGDTGALIYGYNGVDNKTDKLQISGTVMASGYKISGGTSSQYLMADGSVSTGSGGGTFTGGTVVGPTIFTTGVTASTLTLTSVNSGFVPNKMTEAQRLALTPSVAMIVYQTNTTVNSNEGLYIYKSTGWIQII